MAATGGIDALSVVHPPLCARSSAKSDLVHQVNHRPVMARTLTRFLLVLLGATALLSISACNSLTPHEEQQYENLIAQGAEPIEAKTPALAAGLNLLPGFGDIYNGHWGLFAFDLLLWYPSIIWAVPQGYFTAENINKKATIAYYSIGAGKVQGFDANAPPNTTLQPRSSGP